MGCVPSSKIDVKDSEKKHLLVENCNDTYWGCYNRELTPWLHYTSVALVAKVVRYLKAEVAHHLKVKLLHYTVYIDIVKSTTGKQ